MPSFDLGRRSDVVACVFATRHHLVPFARWEHLFRLAHEHLNDGGLFVFDVDTVGRRHQRSEGPSWVHHVEGGTRIMDLTTSSERLPCGDIEIFEHVAGNEPILHHERISDLGVELSGRTAALGEPPDACGRDGSTRWGPIGRLRPSARRRPATRRGPHRVWEGRPRAEGRQTHAGSAP